MSRLVIAALMAFSAPVFAAAQNRGGGAPAAGHAGMAIAHPSAGVSHAAVRAAVSTRSVQASAGSAARPQGTVRRIHHTNRVNDGVAQGAFGTPFNGTDFEDVPGLGFDFPHLAAVSGNRHRRNGFDTFPFGFGGFLLGSPSLIVEAPSEAQAAPEGEGSVVDEAPVAERGRRAGFGTRSMAPRGSDEQDAGSASRNEDPAEYVFVRRDGGLVFAVAYAWENGTLRYVTREGMRRTMAREAIDLAATQQFNEQRGLSFRSPA